MSVICPQVREQAVQSGIVLVVARLLNEDSTIEIVTMSASIIGQVSDVRQFAEEAQRHSVYVALITATSNVLATRRDGSHIDPEMSLEALIQVLIYWLALLKYY
jgi:dTDP-4-dehydrorhamnose 3,5-epimerase-like enzyme